MRMDVKRLAAIDLHGTSGTLRRRRMILAEFMAGVTVMTALGSWLVVGASGLGSHLLGVWLIGAGLNYAPLAAYAIALSRPGALDAELADVDVGRELHRYTLLQLWILVPLALILAMMTVRGPRPGSDQLYLSVHSVPERFSGR